MQFQVQENDAYRDDFAFALWFELMCRCASCGNMLFLDSLENLLDMDPIKWSKAAVIEAMRAGWRYERDKIVCDACAEDN